MNANLESFIRNSYRLKLEVEENVFRTAGKLLIMKKKSNKEAERLMTAQLEVVKLRSLAAAIEAQSGALLSVEIVKLLVKK
jgi:hypothetical protein